MFIWVENLLFFLLSNEDEVVFFIDQYVICYDNKEMLEYVNNQIYRYVSICCKKGELIYRFGFLIFFMDKKRL